LKNKSWYAHGKLLVTGEYMVLEGAKALALPLKLGQYLSVRQQKGNTLSWNAMKTDGFWFQAVCKLPGFEIVKSTDQDICDRLHTILLKTRELNPEFLVDGNGYNVETILEFDPDYGFGSSSTLLTNIAKWANVDPFELQKQTFGGSGYDIACASLRDPVIYHLDKGKPTMEQVSIDFDFTDRIYFVYLGKKQNSFESIEYFRQKAKFLKKDLTEISGITRELLFCKTLADFEKLIIQHEIIMSRILKMKRVQALLFPDHKGVVKSLGGWGGDFVLMTRHSNEKEFESYLRHKGYNTYYCYDDLVL
jgi:mevalonate kinase